MQQQSVPLSPVPAETAAAGAERAGRSARALSWARRHPLLLIGLSPLLPELVGTAFNIWYNATHIDPLLSEVEKAVFFRTVQIYNGAAYPICLSLWLWKVLSLRRPLAAVRRGEPLSADEVLRARRRAINLPWWMVAIGGAGWLFLIPVFLIALSAAPGRLDPRLYADLPISFLISATIATTHGFFLIELLSLRLLYPALFGAPEQSSGTGVSPVAGATDSIDHRARLADTPGAHPLSLRKRGLLWAISAGVCPIASLLVLMLAPHNAAAGPWFAVAVGGLGIAFGLVTAMLAGRLVTEPVDALRKAAEAVARGDLNVHVPLLRADDFGPLIDEFNAMVGGLRDKERIQQTFGRHVGEQAARRILARDPGLGGAEEEVTVMFVDIRDFTARCAQCSPEQVLALLNRFLSEMVEVVEESHGGMVNKFLGDGFMALFGVGWQGPTDSAALAAMTRHADAAVAAGCEILARLERLNRELRDEGYPPLGVGIGIHTGRAVVGSIGSRRRMEYTAIGDTVNVASRVEGLTKQVGRPLLFTESTRAALHADVSAEALPPQRVKGQAEALRVFAMGTAEHGHRRPAGDNR